MYTLFGLLRWHLVNASAYSLSVDLNVPRFYGLKYGYFSLWKLRWLIKFRGSMLMFGRAGSTWPPSFRSVWTTTCLQEFTITALMCLLPNSQCNKQRKCFMVFHRIYFDSGIYTPTFASNVTIRTFFIILLSSIIIWISITVQIERLEKELP